MDSIDFKKIRALESDFLKRHSAGFKGFATTIENKANNIESMGIFSQQVFAKQEFLEPLLIVENMIKVVNGSSVSSFFEKPKFKSYVNSLSATRKVELAEGLKKLLHGKDEKGFNIMLSVLAEGDLAKWPLMSIFAAMYNPNVDVFIKPTVTKKILANFQINHIKYQAKPNWDFYQNYRQVINSIKSELDPSMSPNNLLFCDFLVMENSSNNS